ncbi:FkbM family methyltransferase [Paeniroseomonas aquatica]|uniref:FkbM family methyltransferase n=1 Tax=Paeniroseomonas aquatica TaxID=373043 RepID=A0ABT8A9I1_9PROT|nr:FkbM family methyltransferase [Paeniroseomonas aquatica]MDN3566427.1 FkbM family methyltransferase [Paeniroseomonas aquatica]
MLLTTLVPEASGFPDPWAKPGLQGVYVGDGVMLTRNWLDQLMYVSSTDLIVTPHLLNLGYCEPHLTKVLMSLLQPGQVFVDIGANVGYYSVLGGRAVHPGGTVHAFEPNPAIHRLLADNLEVNGFAPSAIPHRLALSDRAGTAPLLVFEGRTAAATLRPVSAAYAEAFGARTGRTTHAVAVETVRLDDVLAAVPEVHLIKLDAEGHEPAILRGGTELLRRSPAVKLLMEFVPFHYARDEALDHLGLLRDLGFRLYRIEADGGIAEHTDAELLGFDFSDIMALRPGG